jgi:hypothetical protein
MYKLDGLAGGFRTLVFDNPYKQLKLSNKTGFSRGKIENDDKAENGQRFFNYNDRNTRRVCYHYIAWMANIANEKIKKENEIESKKAEKRNRELVDHYANEMEKYRKTKNARTMMSSLHSRFENINISCTALIKPYTTIEDNYITIHTR